MKCIYPDPTCFHVEVGVAQYRELRSINRMMKQTSEHAIIVTVGFGDSKSYQL